MSRSTSTAVILFLAATFLAVPTGAEETRRKVVARSPTQQQMTRYLLSTGSFQAVSSVELVARVSGTLEAIRFRDGDSVRKGEVIFVIEPEPYRISLATAEAELAQQKANLAQAQANLTRQSTLSTQKIVATSALESAEAQAAIAGAQVAAAEARVRSARLNLDYTEIKAPFDGILSARALDQGAYVNAASAPRLASLISPDPLPVVFSANERQVIEIRKAMAARGVTVRQAGAVRVEIGLQGAGDYPITGTLDYIAPDMDPASGTMTLRAVVANPDRLLSQGMFARVRIPLGSREALTIPDSALGTSQLGRTLTIIEPDGRVQSRRVLAGERTDDGRREIVEGLSPTDLVVVEGGAGLRPGDMVEPVDRL